MILLKIKGNASFEQTASLDDEEELSKTWRICTKVKDSLVNGRRLENLSWRLWHMHKTILIKNNRSNQAIVRAIRVSNVTRTLQLDGGSVAIDSGPVDLPPTHVDEIFSQSREMSANPQLLQNVTPPQTVNVQQTPLLPPTPADSLFYDSVAEENDSQSLEHFIKFDDFFGSLPATAFLGDIDTGPRLEISGDNFLDWSQCEDSLFLNSATNVGDVILPASAQPDFESVFARNDADFGPTMLGGVGGVCMPPVGQSFWTEIANNCADMTDFDTCNAMFAGADGPIRQNLDQPSSASSISTTSGSVDDAISLSPQSLNPPFVDTENPFLTPLIKPEPLKNFAQHHRNPPHRNQETDRDLEFPPGPEDLKQICANCRVTSTPLWRRYANDTVLCNACGLYLKLHGAHRPKSMKSTHKGDPPILVCSNCSTTNTPLWRRDERGVVLCNACGLYQKMHKAQRPLSFKSDVIRKRNRSEYSSGTTSAYLGKRSKNGGGESCEE